MEGHDVVVDAEDAIIGGLGGAGKGWGMLMESLGAGRGISLPGQGAGGSKLVARVTSNHATIRKQFGLQIGKFEGVEEPLARIAGYTYTLEALRKYILSALDQGISPPVCTAIAKYNATEMAREVIRDGMDILGGAGISMGPRNLVASAWIGVPISITVEGANILTRTLMIFGQGALRAHPYAFKEVDAVQNGNLGDFDYAFWGHMGHIFRNTFRALLLSFTRGYITAWGMPSKSRRYFQKLAWTSASFAILADLSMGLLGGKLKVKEMITGRFADILSWMFICTAVLRRFEADGRKAEDWPMVEYSLKTGFHKMQLAFDGIYANMDVPLIGLLFKGPVRWWSKLNALSEMPSDGTIQTVADGLLNNSELRDRLTYGIYMPTTPDQALGHSERAYKAVKKAEAIEKKIRKAIKARTLPKKKVRNLIPLALEKGVITAEEHAQVMEAEALRYDAIQVDDFTEEQYAPGYVPSSEIHMVRPLPTEDIGDSSAKK
jgi:acyl-CoA dehydrogenase